MKRTLLALPVVALMSSTAMAQSLEVPPYHPDPGPYAGWWEMTLAGQGTSTENFDQNTFGANVGLGYYLTENVFLGLRQFIGFTVNDFDTWTGQTFGVVDYQFDFGRWQPFVGVSLGGIYGKDVDEDFLWGPEVGLKYYVNESAFAYGLAAYQLNTDECCDDGTFNYTIGFGINF
jgi:hypothetical protein